MVRQGSDPGKVSNADAIRLVFRGPHLQVLNAVIVLLAVNVVDAFMRLQVAAQMNFHHQAMLEHVLTGIALTGRMVWGVNQYVAATFYLAATPPWTTFTLSAKPLAIRVSLLQRATFPAEAGRLIFSTPTIRNKLTTTIFALSRLNLTSEAVTSSRQPPLTRIILVCPFWIVLNLHK